MTITILLEAAEALEAAADRLTMRDDLPLTTRWRELAGIVRAGVKASAGPTDPIDPPHK